MCVSVCVCVCVHIHIYPGIKGYWSIKKGKK